MQEVFSFADACKPRPPKIWFVDRLLAPGSVAMFYGAPATKKTFALIDLLVCATVGKPWLGFATLPINTLFIDEESGFDRFADRLKQAANGEGVIPSGLYFSPMHGYDLGNPVHQKHLREKIMEHDAKLVIIDAFADVIPSRDENNSTEMNDVLNPLRRVVMETGSAVILIHHANKDGSFRGSSAIKAAVDLMIKVVSKDKSCDTLFKMEKNRDGELFDFRAKTNFGDNSFWLECLDGQPDANRELGRNEQYVLTALRHSPEGLTTTAIITDPPFSTSGSIRQTVYHLEKKGRIRKLDNSGKETVWTINA